MRRLVLLAILSFASFTAGAVTQTNASSNKDAVDNTQVVLFSTATSKAGGVALPQRAFIVPTNSVTCLANGHVAINDVDQGSASICYGTTEISCTGGIHIVRNSSACQA